MNNKTLYKNLLSAGFGVTISLTGAYLTMPSEGIVLGTYLDPVGIISSCYGHVDKTLKLGTKYTEEECAKQLGQDLLTANKQLKSVVKVPFTSDYQEAALTDFVYNKGIGNFQSSSILKELNKKNYDGACEQLTRWVFATHNGIKVKLKGLVVRATKEYEWCMSNPPQEVKDLK